MLLNGNYHFLVHFLLAFFNHNFSWIVPPRPQLTTLFLFWIMHFLFKSIMLQTCTNKLFFHLIQRKKTHHSICFPRTLSCKNDLLSAQSAAWRTLPYFSFTDWHIRFLIYFDECIIIIIIVYFSIARKKCRSKELFLIV